MNPASFIVQSEDWDVMAHVLRHHVYRRPHPCPNDSYSREAGEWWRCPWPHESPRPEMKDIGRIT